MASRASLVHQFHRKFTCPSPRALHKEKDVNPTNEANVALILRRIALWLKEKESQLHELHRASRSDARPMRAKLVIGEVAEMLEALADRNEVELLDALADVSYVIEGTAVTYGLPLGSAFNEVHRSNMTKSTVQASVSNHDGNKGKDNGYTPPRLEEIIKEFRLKYRVFDADLLNQQWPE